jgi:transcriptional regulator with XRE-family HTH domain
LLRDHRISRALTQHQLAGLSTVSVRAIRELERGRAASPRRATLQLLADGLALCGDRRTEFELAAGRHGDATAWLLAGDLPDLAPPPPMNGLLGRDAELRVLTDLLMVDNHRVVTVTGLAGVGKTRLAAEVARTLYERGTLPVWWQSTGPTWTGLPRIAEVAGDRNSLLVLDGLTGHAGQVRALAYRCPRLRILLTGPVPLGIPDERVFPLAPLPVPDVGSTVDLPAIEGSPSVVLLVRHIRALRPDFRLTGDNAVAIAQVCRRCDGHPAALARAAIWCAIGSPQLVCEQARPGTVRLLPPVFDPVVAESVCRTLATFGALERRLLARLHGWWSLADAAALTGADSAEIAGAVHTLLVHGMLRGTDQAGETRFRIVNLVRDCVGHCREPVTA